MRYVAVKSAEQQAGQSVHRIRSRLIRARTALVNEIRGLLGEFGLVASRQGMSATRALLQQTLDEHHRLPGELHEMLGLLRDELQGQDERVVSWTACCNARCKTDERVQRLLQAEGVGPISATAMVSAVGDARQFSSGRQFAAWLGLVPSQHSSGGKERL